MELLTISQVEYNRSRCSPQGTYSSFSVFSSSLISFLGVELILCHLQASAALLTHLEEMAHAAHSSVTADSEELGRIFDEMHQDRGATHYAAIFKHEDSAKLVAQLVAHLLDCQGVPLGKDFAKSSYLDSLELSPLPTGESIPVRVRKLWGPRRGLWVGRGRSQSRTDS